MDEKRKKNNKTEEEKSYSVQYCKNKLKIFLETGQVEEKYE